MVKGSVKLGGTFLKMAFHLSRTSVQKGLLTLNICPPGEVGGDLPRRKWGHHGLVSIKISIYLLISVFFLARNMGGMPNVL